MRCNRIIRACSLLACLPILGMMQAAAPNHANPLRVAYCELAKNPNSYDHQLVETDGIYTEGAEIMSFYNLSCAKSEMSSWVDHSEDIRKSSSPESLQKMDDFLNTDGRAHIIAVLKFDGPKPVSIHAGTSDGLANVMRGTNSRYGHMNQFRTRVLLTKIISAEPVPASTPWPSD